MWNKVYSLYQSQPNWNTSSYRVIRLPVLQFVALSLSYERLHLKDNKSLSLSKMFFEQMRFTFAFPSKEGSNSPWLTPDLKKLMSDRDKAKKTLILEGV